MIMIFYFRFVLLSSWEEHDLQSFLLSQISEIGKKMSCFFRIISKPCMEAAYYSLNFPSIISLEYRCVENRRKSIDLNILWTISSLRPEFLANLQIVYDMWLLCFKLIPYLPYSHRICDETFSSNLLYIEKLTNLSWSSLLVDLRLCRRTMIERYWVESCSDQEITAKYSIFNLKRTNYKLKHIRAA